MHDVSVVRRPAPWLVCVTDLAAPQYDVLDALSRLPRPREPVAGEWPAPERAVPTVRGARQTRRRQASWRPAVLPFLVAFAAILGISWWFYSSDMGPVGWVTTVVWTMPTLGSAVGVVGALLTRRRIRRQRRWAPAEAVRHDRLIVVVPTIGRHDTLPALERSVRSYRQHLPTYFRHLRVDVVIEEGCEARSAIDALARTEPGVRVIAVPRWYRTPRGTRFKARANHYAHELRIAEGEAAENIWVLHMDDDTGVGPDTASSVARFITAQRRAGLRANTSRRGFSPIHGRTPSVGGPGSRTRYDRPTTSLASQH